MINSAQTAKPKTTKFWLILLLLSCVGSMTLPHLLAYQSMMKKAKKFGGKDCLFCHVYEDGGEGWNERGLWLIEQKYKRKAEKIDAEWLKDYKPDQSETASESEAKDKISDKDGDKRKKGNRKPRKS